MHQELYDECLKVVVDLNAPAGLSNLFGAPNTFDVDAQEYVWKQYDCMAYAIVPREIESDLVRVDLYVTMDEDDLDDIDLPKYIGDFLKGEILRDAPGFSISWISEPEEWRMPPEIARRSAP